MITTQTIQIDWNECKPFFYGWYQGKLKTGETCAIDVDWKIKAYKSSGEQVGTDEIQCWCCNADQIKSIIKHLETTEA